MEVSDVEIKDWNTGISICSDNSKNPEMNLTLSGDVKFEKKAPLNTDIDFPTSGEGKVNLHFNDLTTRRMMHQMLVINGIQQSHLRMLLQMIIQLQIFVLEHT